jgi:tetratricopeptide (TPR) repeat protein
MIMQRFWVVVMVSAMIACASGPKKLSPAELAAQAHAAAQVLVQDGCYACLLEARETYERVAVGPARRPLIVPMFETELLIVLREKEFAMDASGALARARTLSAELPPEVDGVRYLAIVDAVSRDAMGVPQAEESAFRRERASYIPKIDGEIAWLATGPLQPVVRQYLSLSIDCKNLHRGQPPGRALTVSTDRNVPADAPPLIAYRIATCDNVKLDVLESLKAQVPRFSDTAFFRARLLAANAELTGGPGARPLLDEAHEHFPMSPSVTYLNGNFQQSIGDCREALRFYDETLALKPLHENALLGRTVCLTYLKRQDEAIATATQMIELRTFNVHEAYFWRAWIQHDRKALPAARADINSAKSIASTGNIHRLAGMIEYDQDDLDVAERDLQAAKNASGGGADCVARWYLGLVAVKRPKALDAAEHFEQAMTCYEAAVFVSEAGLRAIEAKTDLDPDFRARQIEGFKAAVELDRSQYHAAAFNAANYFVQAGNRDKARVLIEVAAKDPALEKVVAQLRKIIGG